VPVPDALLTTPDGKPGLKADYNEGMRRGPGGPNSPTIVSRIESNVKLSGANLPSQVASKKTFGVQWSGFLTPTESGDFLLGIRCAGFCRVAADGKQIALAFGGGLASQVGRVHLDKGRKAALEVSYGTRDGKAQAELIWTKANNAPSPEAITAAKNADVVIAVVGITSQLEGEEMPVSEPEHTGPEVGAYESGN
jgi:beta-glucosidase